MKVDANEFRPVIVPPTQQTPSSPSKEGSTPIIPTPRTEETSGHAAAPVDQVSVSIRVSRNTLDTIRRLGDLSEFLNTTAKSLRQTDEGLSAGADIVGRMKAELEKIIKNFPPFPADSKKREEILNSYSAIQKEILRLTIPPPPPPVYEKVQHLWQNLFTPDERKLAVPELPDNAPDSHIQAAYQSLNGTAEVITAIRDDLNSQLKA